MEIKRYCKVNQIYSIYIVWYLSISILYIYIWIYLGNCSLIPVISYKAQGGDVLFDVSKNYIGEYDLVKSLDIVVSLYPSFPPLCCFYHLSKVHIAMILAMQKLCALAESSSSTPVLPTILTLPAFYPVTLHHQPTLATPVGSFGTLQSPFHMDEWSSMVYVYNSLVFRV